MSLALGLGVGRPRPAAICGFSGFIPVVEGWTLDVARPLPPVALGHGTLRSGDPGRVRPRRPATSCSQRARSCSTRSTPSRTRSTRRFSLTFSAGCRRRSNSRIWFGSPNQVADDEPVRCDEPDSRSGPDSRVCKSRLRDLLPRSDRQSDESSLASHAAQALRRVSTTSPRGRSPRSTSSETTAGLSTTASRSSPSWSPRDSWSAMASASCRRTTT